MWTITGQASIVIVLPFILKKDGNALLKFL